MQKDTHQEEIEDFPIEHHFSIDSPLGSLYIRSSATHITAIEFRDKHEGHKFANTPLELQCEAELTEYFEGKRREFTFPIAQEGTEFQKKVWEELSNIPFGKTISYHELAVRLGDPKCIRAAGTANGRNNIAIVVPCHRVIGSDGSLTGYAGGVDKKEWLLRHEGSLPGMNQLDLF